MIISSSQRRPMLCWMRLKLIQQLQLLLMMNDIWLGSVGRPTASDCISANILCFGNFRANFNPHACIRRNLIMFDSISLTKFKLSRECWPKTLAAIRDHRSCTQLQITCISIHQHIRFIIICDENGKFRKQIGRHDWHSHILRRPMCTKCTLYARVYCAWACHGKAFRALTRISQSTIALPTVCSVNRCQYVLFTHSIHLIQSQNYKHLHSFHLFISQIAGIKIYNRR